MSPAAAPDPDADRFGPRPLAEATLVMSAVMLEDDGRGGHLPRDVGLVAEACHGLPHGGLWSRHGAEPDLQTGRERSLGP